MKQLRLTFCALALLATASCDRNQTTSAEEAEAETLHDIRYGIIADDYRLEEGEVAQGETMGKILNRYGISAVAIDRLDKASEKTFPLRNIRAGQKYVAFIHEDSLFAPHLDYLAYERSLSDYVVFGFHGDSVSVRTGEKEFTTRRTKKSAVISSSLWGSIMEKNLPYALAAELEDIYQWTVDFFGIQKGDSFTVIYDERFIDDSVSVGIGRIWGARFDHGGKEYYAIPFRQGGKIQYWEADGGSLRKQMLKAPLKYTRISSKFTYANTLKIKHPGNMMTGYLHLSGFAKGIAQGKHVTQGQLIGYVGSTGASTGPHLDYRVWRNGKPINPLTIPQEPSEPISKDNRAEFEFIRDRIMAELNGDVPAEERIVQLDSIVIPEGFVARELGTPAGKEQKSEAAKAQSGTKKS